MDAAGVGEAATVDAEKCVVERYRVGVALDEELATHGVAITPKRNAMNTCGPHSSFSAAPAMLSADCSHPEDEPRHRLTRPAGIAQVARCERHRESEGDDRDDEAESRIHRRRRKTTPTLTSERLQTRGKPVRGGELIRDSAWRPIGCSRSSRLDSGTANHVSRRTGRTR